jgi:hypothetical protein
MKMPIRCRNCENAENKKMLRLIKPKPKCPNCNCQMIKKDGRLECICGLHCHLKADRCCTCGVILDEED